MVLAVVDLLKIVHPLFDRAGHVVESDAIDVGSWSAADAFACSVLPHSSCVHVAVVHIIGLVKAQEYSSIKAEIVGDLL